MNKYLRILVVSLALATTAYFLWPNLFSSPVVENGVKVMTIEDYVSQNISDLSPEKEVLGGKFYTTSIEASQGSGVVSYEDGHIAFTADFTYETDRKVGHTITSFEIRD